jgi:hypothetical protein
MAVLARGDQFTGVGRQIGKGRRQGHGLPANQPAPQRPAHLHLVLKPLDVVPVLLLRCGQVGLGRVSTLSGLQYTVEFY